MIIDIHTHVFPDFLAKKAVSKLESYTDTISFVDGTLQGLASSMAAAEVDLSILLPVATSVSQVVKCNDGAVSVNQEQAGKFLSFGAMHPDYEDYRGELKRMKDMGLKGIKLHPDYQETMFDDIKYKRILAYATELDLITLVHAGVDIGLPGPVHAAPKSIQNVIRDVQPEKLILAHMGGFYAWEEVMDLLAGEQVYLDTAFTLGSVNYRKECPVEQRKFTMMNEELFVEMVHVFGVDRVLFGTDSPWSGQKETLDVFRSLSLTTEEKNKILGENAVSLLKL